MNNNPYDENENKQPKEIKYNPSDVVYKRIGTAPNPNIGSD